MNARRALIKALAIGPAVLLVPPASATDYASAAEALDAVDHLEAEVDRRLEALGRALASARRLATSMAEDHQRHRTQRGAVRRRLRLPPPASPRGAAPADELSLAALSTAQEALVYAHAEGLPALGDRYAVDVLARHLVDESRHLTVIALWIESETARG